MSSLWAPWSLRDLVSDLRSGRTTPVAALERSRDRRAETETVTQAWVELASKPHLAGAAGPLGDVPMGVKDIIDVAGLPTRCGSRLRAGAPPAVADAAIVTSWRGAGAVPVGKTVTTEFAFFAPGPTRNPANPAHTPGGSSSGSAAAVASGHVPLALGSQTAGSVTRPAAYTGVAALVMSHGRFPLTGVTGLSGSLDSHGVYAATTADLGLAWSALTGAPDHGVRGRRPGRLLRWSAAPFRLVSDEMAHALEVGVSALRDVEVVDFPDEQLILEAAEAHPVVMAYEAARERGDELARADELSAPLAHLLTSGAALPDADYRDATAVLARARARVVCLLQEYDAILGPAAPGAAPAGLDATGDPVLSRPWQALGAPQVTVPGLRSSENLPLGIQLIGAHRGEEHLLAHAAAVELSIQATISSKI